MGVHKDYTGQKFGYLEVIKLDSISPGNYSNTYNWLCKCHRCGGEKVVKRQNLHRQKSCGCFRGTSPDLTNKSFGYLVAKERVIKSHSKWVCRCKCGNEHIVRSSFLLSGQVRSCGCIKNTPEGRKRRIDIEGKQFGNLKAIKYLYRKNNSTYWLCECSCGNKKAISLSHLKSGATKSCGCLMGFPIKHGLCSKNGDRKAYYRHTRKEDPFRALRHTISGQIRRVLKKNKAGSVFKYLPYSPEELRSHIESLFEDWMSWNNFGGRPCDKRKTWWLDHIVPQSKFPYQSLDDPLFQQCWTLDNLRPLEKIKNIKKGDKLIK